MVEIDRSRYGTPLVSRYTSEEMQALFSEDRKFSTWRKLWLALAKAQKQLGLNITDEQIAEMEAHLFDINYDRVAEIEAKTRHDVMAHIHAYGELCPTAAPIIHLGATSCYVTDNTDLILMREGLEMLAVKLARDIHHFSQFAEQHKALPCLGFTHLMPAQLVTVGKRACMWIVDLLMDLEELIEVGSNLKFLGSKGATGTQTSFLSLFNGDLNKVNEINRIIASEFGFNKVFRITGQTYPRKVDTIVLNALAGLGQSVHKMNLDLRILQSKKEIEEPFGKSQVGSTAMAYKRNPMTEERGCSLGRHPLALALEAAMTHMTQLFERTLDDSAGRRIYLAEAFLTADALLIIMQFIGQGLVVYPKVIHRHVMEELPFMATEDIIMAMVTAGGDRQECHEQLRVLSQEAGDNVKLEGGNNDLIERIRRTAYFAPIHSLLDTILEPTNFIGGIPEMVDDFLQNEVRPALETFAKTNQPGGSVELKV